MGYIPFVSRRLGFARGHDLLRIGRRKTHFIAHLFSSVFSLDRSALLARKHYRAGNLRKRLLSSLHQQVMPRQSEQLG
jgi:hypothetical protein